MSRVAIFTDSASDLDPAEAAAEGIAIVPLLVTFGAETLQGRRRALDRRRSGSGWSRRMRRSRRPRRRRPASSRRPTRRRSPPAPRRSSRSMSPGPCRARSRAPRSRATCCPTARSTSSTRSARRWPRGSWPGWASRWPPRAGRPRRSPRRLEARAPDMRHVRRPRDARVPQEGRPDQRRPGGHRDAAVGQADHRASSTASSRRPTGSGPGRRRASGCIELICERPDRAAGDPPHGQPRRRGVPRRGPRPSAGGLDAADVTIDLVGRVGRAAPRSRLRRRRGPLPGVTAAGRRADRHGDRRQVATRLRRRLPTGTIGRATRRPTRAILGAADESRAVRPATSSGPDRAPRGVVRETTHTDEAASDRRPTRRISSP